MFRKTYRPGDRVIYRLRKHSTSPGPRAHQIHAAVHGDCYDYFVDKQWLIARLFEDGKALIVTRRGKRRIVDLGDPHLRHAKWWERILYHGRFPRLPLSCQFDSVTSSST